MNYEYVDLGLIFINLLFCGLLLYRQNKLTQKQIKLEKLIIINIRNPKLGKRAFASYNKTKQIAKRK